MKNFVKLTVKGKNPLYFLERLYKEKIDHEVLKSSSSMLIIKVSDTQYHKINKMVTSYEIKVIGHHGFKNIYYRFKNNLIELFALITFLLTILFLSCLVFDIKIVTSNQQLTRAIKSYNDKIGFKRWALVFNVERFELSILEKFNDQIEWMEIEKHGTKYIINIEERKINPIITKKAPANIVASKNAVVKKITALSGDIVVVNNQYVNKGDVLVSGVIRHNEKEKARINANAVVYGEVWVSGEIYIPFVFQETKFYESKQTWSINLLSRKIYIFSKPYNKNKVTIIKQIKHPILPLGFSLNRNQKYKESIYFFNVKEAIIYGNRIIDQKIISQLKDGEYIISKKQLKQKQIDSKMYIEVFYKLYQRIDRKVLIK